MLSDLINAGRPVRFHTHDEARVHLSRACGKSGDRAGFEVIGRSESGTGIYAIRMGTGPVKVALAAGAHADEPVGPETLRLLIVAGFAKPQAAEILERCTLYIVPHVNPDAEGANVRTWGQEWPDSAAYVRDVVREAPGRDVEFGYPGMRPENRAAAEYWRTNGPFELYVNLHGMSFAEGGMLLPERVEHITDGHVVACQPDLDRTAGERFEMSAEMNGCRHQIVYALTQQISGSEPSISFHESPSFDEPKSLPFFVPKKILSPAEPTASRKITSYAFFCGSPFVRACHDFPSSRVR